MAATPLNPELRKVRCPRCGYDQRGVVETWKDACPLDGVCSECGLVFAWAHVFNRRLFPPTWCAEFGRPWSVPWRCVTTFIVSALPFVFWRTLQMHHQPNWRRIVVYLLTLLIFVYLAFTIEVGTYAYKLWQQYDVNNNRLRSWASAITPAQIQQLSARQGVNPAAFVPFKSASAVQAVGWAILTPFSDVPSGYTQYPDGTRRPYNTPREIVQMRFGTSQTTRMIHRRRFMWTTVFPLFFAGVMPAGFLLLPISRKVARVRWQHIARIAAYGCIWLAFTAAWWIHRLPGDRDDRDRWGEFAFTAFILAPAALMIWWGFAISRHLRMRRPWTITAALAIVAYLSLMVCGYFWLIVERRPDWFMPG